MTVRTTSTRVTTAQPRPKDVVVQLPRVKPAAPKLQPVIRPKPSPQHKLPKVPQDLSQALALAREARKGLLTSQYYEHSYFIDEIEGELPAGLRGTLLKNGPGLFEVGNQQLQQPWDGDGMVCNFSFDGQGRVHFTNKFVRTPGFIEERRTGVPQQRSAFNRGMPKTTGSVDIPLLGRVNVVNPLDFTVKDTANTSVVRWGGRTLALYERGVPWVLGSDLSTLGPSTLDETMRSKFMAAHYRVFQELDGSRRLCLFSTDDSGADGVATVYEYDEQFKLLHRTQVRLPGTMSKLWPATLRTFSQLFTSSQVQRWYGGAYGFYHDFAVTEHYYVLLQNRMNVDVVKVLTQASVGLASLCDCMVHDTNVPPRVHLIPRPGRGSSLSGVRSFDVSGEHFFTLHLSNAYEMCEDGSTPSMGQSADYLVMDTLSSEKMDLGYDGVFDTDAYYGKSERRTDPRRTVIDLRTGATQHHRFTPRMCEMPNLAPSVVGRPHTHMYCVGAATLRGDFFGPHQGILKLSTSPLNGVTQPYSQEEVVSSYWQPDSPVEFTSEPIFVPRTADDGATLAEDDGWVMVMVYDADSHRTHLAILDAQQLEQGPVARLHLPHFIPTNFHGMWTPDCLCPPPGTPNKAPQDIRVHWAA